MSIGELRGCDHLFLCRTGTAEADVLEDCAAKEDGVLKDVAGLVAEMLHFVLTNIIAVNAYRACLRVVKARDEADHSGFSAAGGSDDSDELAWLNFEGEIAQYEFSSRGSFVRFDCVGNAYRIERSRKLRS